MGNGLIEVLGVAGAAAAGYAGLQAGARKIDELTGDDKRTPPPVQLPSESGASVSTRPSSADTEWLITGNRPS